MHGNPFRRSSSREQQENPSLSPLLLSRTRTSFSLSLRPSGGSPRRSSLSRTRSSGLHSGTAKLVQPFHVGIQSYCSSKCVLLGVSCGANIADFVARKAVKAGKLIEPVKVVAQVLMYPFFARTVPTHSELRLAG
ncbi:hypothetical protein ZIOFF_057907 [Zingiber officinale]|uniref:Alpha/beta hydrolase fold-3 domain-containing protein n=1 Tax=Zingiber officinale TaxID=94328 RepID=A0A8J5FAA6_ZINOF|nr:hypothetical protein ZIOFF_057907 [Zingiber officinale]